MADSANTGNKDLDKAIGNLAANLAAGGIGAVAGGGSGAATAANAERFNRQLHPDERQWAKDKAKDFARFYEEQTGRALTPEQAEKMLLANGYRLVDAFASKGPGGDKYAVAFISANTSHSFSANPAERFDPGSLTGPLAPEQNALPAHGANPQLGTAAGAGLGLIAVGSVAPAIATGWALGTFYDYAGDAVNFASGLSTEPPNFAKSFGVGGVSAAFVPLGLPLSYFSQSMGGTIVAATYNAGLAGTASFGASSIFSPAQNPGLAGGLAMGATIAGWRVQGAVPGSLGVFLNTAIQVNTGPVQTNIEKLVKENR